MITKMTKTEKQLRRGLYISLRFYQHPVSQSVLNHYNLDFSIWKSLVTHGCLEQTNDKLITLSDKGLLQAKRLFPTMSKSLSNLKRVPKFVSVFGFVFVSRVVVNGRKIESYYFDEDGNETTDERCRLFIDEDDWRTKKHFEQKFGVRGTRTSELVSKEVVDSSDSESQVPVDYSDWLK